MPTMTLCQAMRRVPRAMVTASTRRSKRSTSRTTSAACTVEAAPRAPMATPTSAAARAGASLVPSPIMITVPDARARLILSSLSAGDCSAKTSVMPRISPTDCAMSIWSPVSMA
ncbi:hypothetical protein D3C87_1143820 [compost metagenome]